MMRRVLASLFIVALVQAAEKPDDRTGAQQAGVDRAGERKAALDGAAKDKKAAADAKAAKDAKMAAVNKVIALLEDLQAQVLAEGEAEAKSYNKFACFCKENAEEKLSEITNGRNAEGTLNSDLTKQEEIRTDKDGEIKAHLKNIKDAEEEITRLEGERAKTLKVYELNEADLAGAIEAIAAATKVLKASDVSFVQLQGVSKTVSKALLMADALGYGDDNTQKAIAFFQNPATNYDTTSNEGYGFDDSSVAYGERGDATRGSGKTNANVVPMQDYDFHSGHVVDMLAQMEKDFITKKSEVDREETSSVATHNLAVQEQTKIVKAQNTLLNRAREEKETAHKNVADLSQQLADTSAELLADQAYMMELHEMCAGKQKAWVQRSQVRADEISAIVSAVTIVKSQVAEKTSKATVRLTQKSMQVFMSKQRAHSPEALEAIESEAEQEDASPSFLQIRPKATQEDARSAVVNYLRGTGDKIKSSLLISLAGKLGTDPFAKIKVLIQALIERLLAESANEADQKGFCDKELGDAEQKRDLAAEAITKLDAEMTEGEATLFSLSADIKKLATEIGALNVALAAATNDRNEEKAANAATVLEAKAGEKAVGAAIDILKKFYSENKDNTVLIQGPMDDAPDAGFANDEAYTGAQAEAGGILGMLDVILSDFSRTIRETKKSEKAAVAEFYKFETETNMALAAKESASGIKKTEYNKLKDDLIDANGKLETEVTGHNTAIETIESLQKQCVDTGMSYEDRVRLREEELVSLKKALCILRAYEQYGPDGLSDAC